MLPWGRCCPPHSEKTRSQRSLSFQILAVRRLSPNAVAAVTPIPSLVSRLPQSNSSPSAISAVARLQRLRLRVIFPLVTASPTLPANFTEVPEDMFPPILKSRVSAIIPFVLENTFALVIRKKLTETDLQYRHLCLSFPEKQIASDFLTDGENMLLEK
ncbi:hypothetical protein LINPERPRIM_LOCUS15058 [Linum perenne]